MVIQLTTFQAWYFASGLTVRQLSKETGISPGYLSKLCRGRRSMGGRTASALAKRTGLRWDRLTDLLEIDLSDRAGADNGRV